MSSLLLLVVLTGCPAFGPMPLSFLAVMVNNENGTCTGSLKARVTRGARGEFEPATASAGELVHESFSTEQEGFDNPFGNDYMAVKVTAWCYSGDGVEVGYNEEMVSVQAAYGTGHIMVVPEADFGDVYIDGPLTCDIGKEATGTPICIFDGP